jgi:hypothetical protein
MESNELVLCEKCIHSRTEGRRKGRHKKKSNKMVDCKACMQALDDVLHMSILRQELGSRFADSVAVIAKKYWQ